tara:strand:- start:715 stop:1104 length:390 start_codon:yes stop_codon:yes gene_type:complete
LANLNLFQDIILISIGAVFGVNSRFLIYQKLKEININGKYSIFLINTFSSFFLGFFISISSKITSLNVSSQLVLFFVIGFLGSLSTFSTFIYDLFQLFREYKFLNALKLFIFSYSLGTSALALGSLLGN